MLFQQTTEEVDAWLATRRAKGLDGRDEVWEGVYVVMAPAPSLRHGWIASQLITVLSSHAEAAGLRVADTANVGSANDYRVPDVVVFSTADADPTGVWLRTAKIVVEIRSPGEAHEEKLPFYASRQVDEVVLVDPELRKLRWLALSAAGVYQPAGTTRILDVGPAAQVEQRLRWE